MKWLGRTSSDLFSLFPVIRLNVDRLSHVASSDRLRPRTSPSPNSLLWAIVPTIAPKNSDFYLLPRRKAGRLYVSPIQWRNADLTADILPRILSRSDLPFSLLLYKALGKLFLLFFSTNTSSSPENPSAQFFINVPGLRISVTTSVRNLSLRKSLRALEIVVRILALNYLLRSEIYINEDGQLCVTHLILGYESLSRAFLDIGQSIRAGSPRLARIDVSKSRFLARDDIRPVVLLGIQNPQPVAQPLPQDNPEVAARVEEEIESSCLSLEEERDEFYFEEDIPKAPLIELSDIKGE
uniref:Uncharacterized protein n=1 Tax=Quercus lobata TaxID=97700 RepID=A0A7N2MCG4_QUELO